MSQSLHKRRQIYSEYLERVSFTFKIIDIIVDFLQFIV